MLPKFLHKQIQVLWRFNKSNSHKCWEFPFFNIVVFRIWVGRIRITESCGICLALHSQIIRTFSLEMSMSIALEASDSLSRLRLLPIFLPKFLPITLGRWKLSIVKRLPTVVHLQKFSEVLCKECYFLLHIIFFEGVVHSLDDGFKSERFAQFIRRQSQLICLERSN